jgi:hypothetical protein
MEPGYITNQATNIDIHPMDFWTGDTDPSLIEFLVGGEVLTVLHRPDPGERVVHGVLGVECSVGYFEAANPQGAIRPQFSGTWSRKSIIPKDR